MDENEKRLLRVAYAAIAMHAMIIARGDRQLAPEDAGPTPIAAAAFNFADAMLEAGGPLE